MWVQQSSRHREPLDVVLSVPWTGLILYDVLHHWELGPPRWAVLASFAYPVLYLGVAWGTSFRRSLKRV